MLNMDEREVMSMSISEQFTGLPMKDLIGSPLAAAADASINLANSTADFINRVGFDKDGNVRNVAFKYEKISKNEDGTLNLDAMKVDVPMLAIVPIPNLQVDEVNVLFDMEVKQSEKTENTLDLSAAAKAKLDLGLFSVSVSGSVSVHQNNTRSSDNSAKYHVDVRAANHGTPEGLARVLDMMAANVAPSLIGSSLKDENGQDLVGDAKAKAENRKKLLNEKKALDRRVNAAQNLLDTALLALKRNMDDQMSQYRLDLIKMTDTGDTEKKDVVVKNDDAANKGNTGEKEKTGNKGNTGNKEDTQEKKSKGVISVEELDQKWASAQNLLAQNIKILATDNNITDNSPVSDILGLFGLKTDSGEIVKYVKDNKNEAKYEAIRISQNNAVKRQKELNALEDERLIKIEEYNEAFNG